MQPQTTSQNQVTLDRLYHLIKDDLAQVNKLLIARIQEKAPLITEVAHHIIDSGGKRIRPAITLISSQLCDYKGMQHIDLAAAVELLHTATLLHDDVVDESDLRRGLPTANHEYGNKASILVGDFLLSQAFQLMASTGSLAALRILSDASAVISQGEVLQLMHQGSTEIGEKNYLQIIQSKTAVLFASAAELGAVLSDRPDWHAPLRNYGMAIGMAFQLVDDALDYAANQQTLGKTIGDDFREGKVTLPVLVAYAAGSEEEKKFWQRTMTDGQQQEGDLQQAMHYIAKHQGIKQTITMAEEEASKAKEYLSGMPASPAREAMEEIADFCIARAY